MLHGRQSKSGRAVFTTSLKWASGEFSHHPSPKGYGGGAAECGEKLGSYTTSRRIPLQPGYYKKPALRDYPVHVHA